MNYVKLYTLPTCGICKIMKMKLDKKNIEYQELNLEDYMTRLNTDRAPVLQVNDKLYYRPKEINDWINQQ